MMTYSREAIVAAIAPQVDGGYSEVDVLIERAGVDPYILTVASTVGESAAFGDPLRQTAGEVSFLRGVLLGLALEETRERPEAEQHFEKFVDAAELDFHLFQKKGTTYMARVAGAFSVRTKEGLAHCPDGWLAVDVEGDLYPVADTVARASYGLGR